MEFSADSILGAITNIIKTAIENAIHQERNQIVKKFMINPTFTAIKVKEINMVVIIPIMSVEAILFLVNC